MFGIGFRHCRYLLVSFDPRSFWTLLVPIVPIFGSFWTNVGSFGLFEFFLGLFGHLTILGSFKLFYVLLDCFRSF